MRRADLHRRALQGLLLIAGALAATTPGVNGIAAAQGQSIAAFEATPPSVFIATRLGPALAIESRVIERFNRLE